MLDRVDLHRAFGQGGRAFDRLDLIDIGIDEGLVGQIDAAEFEAMAIGCGFEGEGDLLSGVERGSFEGGWAGEGVLEGGGHSQGSLIFPSFGSSRNKLIRGACGRSNGDLPRIVLQIGWIRMTSGPALPVVLCDFIRWLGSFFPS